MDFTGTQLGQQRLCRVDGYGEADADVPSVSLSRKDCCGDPYNAIVNIDQRTSGVSWIDGGVGLQHVLEAAFSDRERTTFIAHYTDSDCMPELKGVADGHHPVARLQRIRVAERHHRQIPWRVLQLDHCGAGKRAAAYDGGGFHLSIVAKHPDAHLSCPRDNMIVRENLPLAANQEAGAKRALHVLAGVDGTA